MHGLVSYIVLSHSQTPSSNVIASYRHFELNQARRAKVTTEMEAVVYLRDRTGAATIKIEVVCMSM